MSEQPFQTTWKASLANPGFWGVLLLSSVVLALQVSALPPLAASEGKFGAGALRARQWQFPAWIEEEPGVGALKSYFDAPVVWLLGPSTRAIRLSSFVFRLLDVGVLFWLLRLLFGLRPAILGALLWGLWDGQFNDYLLSAQSGGLVVLLAHVCWLLLAKQLRSPSIPWAVLLGLVSGLGLWNSPYFLLFGVPLALAMFLELSRSCCWGFGLGLFLGSLPNLYSSVAARTSFTWKALGRKLEFPNLFSDLFSAVVDGLARLVHPSLSNFLAFRPGQGNLFFSLLLLLLPVLFFCKAKAGRFETRDARFWSTAIRGALGLSLGWLWLESSFSASGPSSSLMSLFLGMVPLLCACLARERGSWTLGLATGLLVLPSSINLFRLPEKLEFKEKSYELVNAILWQLERTQATYVAGGESLDQFFYWSGGRVAGIELLPSLRVNPRFFQLPRPGSGILVVQVGSAFERALESLRFVQGLLGRSGFQPLEAPEGYRLFLLSQQKSQAGFFAPIQAEVDFFAKYSAFWAGEAQEAWLDPGLLSFGRQFREHSSDLVFLGGRAGEFFLYGPYLPMSAGRYEITFFFEPMPGLKANLTCDLWSVGQRRSLWSIQKDLSSGGARIRGVFDIAQVREDIYESRVFVNRIEGKLCLRGVRLRRMTPDASSWISAATRYVPSHAD